MAADEIDSKAVKKEHVSSSEVSDLQVGKTVVQPAEADRETSQKLYQATLSVDGYKTAVQSELDAESNWRHAVPKGKTALSAREIKDLLKNSSLDAQSKGFLHFLQDNFLELAGTASHSGSVDSSKITMGDVVAIGGMNEVSPQAMQAGVKFLKDDFFPLSGFDNKVTRERVEKLLFDHSFLLLPKETQDLMFDLKDVVKSSDQLPADFENGRRTKSGLTEEQAKSIRAGDLSDNLRIQKLEKGMFGTAMQNLDSNQLGTKAKSQYDSAAQRYRELKDRLDGFLSK